MRYNQRFRFIYWLTWAENKFFCSGGSRQPNSCAFYTHLCSSLSITGNCHWHLFPPHHKENTLRLPQSRKTTKTIRRYLIYDVKTKIVMIRRWNKVHVHSDNLYNTAYILWNRTWMSIKLTKNVADTLYSCYMPSLSLTRSISLTSSTICCRQVLRGHLTGKATSTLGTHFLNIIQNIPTIKTNFPLVNWRYQSL